MVRLVGAERYVGIHFYSLLNEFSNQVKGQVQRNQDFLLNKYGFERVKEDFKTRMKQTTGTLHKRVDGVWTEAEATAKKVYANVEEKISVTKEEVKESFGVGKQEAPRSSSHSDASSPNTNGSSDSASAKSQKEQQSGFTDSAETVYRNVKSAASSKVSPFIQKIKEAKPVDFAKKGYDIILDELKGTPVKRKHSKYSAHTQETSSNFERSTRTDVVVLPSKQSKWETFKEKMQRHPLSKRFTAMCEPLITTWQEFTEDVHYRLETSDNSVVQKFQDFRENMIESLAAMPYKEIYSRDPSFSLPEFVDEVQEVIQPVLEAYFKGDTKVLKEHCSNQIIEVCKAQHQAFDSEGIVFDNKILHISDMEVQEKKMMEGGPIIILRFQRQQVHCIRDKLGSIIEGGKDTIHTVHYAWAMQLGDDSIWRLREMQQFGVVALI